MKCSREVNKEKYRATAIGWDHLTWSLRGSKSKNFKEYSVYIIKLLSETETFYKIGKTFVGIEKRLKKLNNLYNWQLICQYTGSAMEMSLLEKKLHKINKKYKYTPKLKFGGMYECFSRVELDE